MSAENKALKDTKLRSSKYLNNLIEQDHRGIKSRARSMLGFKNFDRAAIAIAGIELLHRIPENQFAPARPASGRHSCACDLECSARCIIPCFSSARPYPPQIFAPEPYCLPTTCGQGIHCELPLTVETPVWKSPVFNPHPAA